MDSGYQSRHDNVLLKPTLHKVPLTLDAHIAENTVRSYQRERSLKLKKSVKKRNNDDLNSKEFNYMDRPSVDGASQERATIERHSQGSKRKTINSKSNSHRRDTIRSFVNSKDSKSTSTDQKLPELINQIAEMVQTRVC